MSNREFDTVILLHGIRTQACWAEMVASTLKSDVNVEVIPIRYGYFDLIRFLLPGITRTSPIIKVTRELRSLLQKRDSRRILVIAHSFGTYIITRILSENPDIQLGGLVLCGGIVDEEFRWDIFSKSIVDSRIINECADKDIWPIFAKQFSWGYGVSGVNGFGSTNVHDRFHDFGHSDFFSKSFVQKYWVPLIQNWSMVEPDYIHQRVAGSWIKSLFLSLPFKTLLLLGSVYVFASPLLNGFSSDTLKIPNLNLSQKEVFFKKEQFEYDKNLINLSQEDVPYETNGYFNMKVIANNPSTNVDSINAKKGIFKYKYAELLTVKSGYGRDLYVYAQIKPLSNIKSIELIGCDVWFILKTKGSAFFYSSEQNASPNDIPIEFDVNISNEIGLRQVDNKVTGYINGKPVGNFTLLSSKPSCKPGLAVKINNPDIDAELYFQGYSIYQF